MNINHTFILKDGQPLLCDDLLEWGRWFETAERHIGLSRIGDSNVSTVFLGLDHNWSDGPPILWETMVFGGALDQEQDRCAGNREQAEAMHQKWVKRTIAAEFTWWRCFKRSCLSLCSAGRAGVQAQFSPKGRDEYNE